MFKTSRSKAIFVALVLFSSLVFTWIVSNQNQNKNLKTDLLTPTNSALPFLCSSVSAASSSNAAGNSPGNLNYGISMWYGVGSVSPYSNLGAIGNELGTLSDSNVFEQRYVGATSAALGVGASDVIGEQTLTVTCDTGTITVYTPVVTPVATNMRLYVVKDGSTYHSRADHNYSISSNVPDLSPQQALRPEHLAKASPTYQADCYNTATFTYSEWSCDGTNARKRTKFASGYGYVGSTNTCSNSQLDTAFETENCATGLSCNAGQCGNPTYTVDDDFNSSMGNFNVSNFSSLQSAMDAAPAGATIKINAGLYTGNFTANKNLIIEGASASQVILDGNGSNTVFTVTSATGFSISGITVRNSGKGDATPGNVGIHIKPSGTTTGTYMVYDSAIYANRNGLVLWNGLNATAIIQNNMIFRNTDAAFSNDGFGQTSLHNNTISDNGGNGYYDWVGKGPHTFRYNIIVNNSKYGYITHRDSTPRTISYNNVWNNKLGNYMEGYTGYATLVPSPGTGEISVDPQFTNRTNADYTLSSSSPLNGLQMGSNIILGTTDLSPLVISSSSVPGSTNGLIGHWKFDGNGNNEVVNGVTAATTGSAAFKTSGGKYGGYAYIQIKGDSVKIPYSSVFDLPTAFTIEFWFKQRANQSFFQDLVYKGSGQNNYNFRIFRQLWNQYNFGPIIAGHTSSKTNYWTQSSNPNELSHNEWHHVLYTKGSTQTAYYLDGNLIMGGSQSDPAVTPATEIFVGSSAVDTDIDNLRIYNREMLVDEVRSNGGFPPQSSTPTTTSPTTTTPPPSNSSGTGLLATGSTTTTTSGTGLLATGSTTTTTSGTGLLTTGSTTTPTPTSSTGTYSSAPSTTSNPQSISYPPNSTPPPYSGTGPLMTGSTTAQYSTLPTPTGYPPAPNSGMMNPSTPGYTPTPFYTSAESTSAAGQLPSGVTISPVLLRSLEAAEKTLADFAILLQDLQTQEKSSGSLLNAQDLLEDGRYYASRIHEALTVGDQKFASRRLGVLNQVIEDIHFEWEHLTRTFANADVSVSLPTFAEAYNPQQSVKDELKNYAVDEIADKITQLIISKINYTDILNQVVQQLQQNKDIVDKLFQYTAKHEAQVSKTMDVLVTVNESFHEDYLSSKVNVLEKVDAFDEAVGKLSLQKHAMDELEILKEKIMGYNFVGPLAEQMVARLAEFSVQLGEGDQMPQLVEDQIDAFSQDIEVAIQESTDYKFDQGYIPFKDTDDQHWFTQYVGPIKEKGIISGYKDDDGNALGEFGPGNNMTVAEILKIALEASELGQGDPNQVPVLLKDHWAAGYLNMAQERGLTLAGAISTSADLDRPATRAEVIRVLIESFGINLSSNSNSNSDASFEDTEGHVDGLFITTAKDLGIVDGYPDGTFQPDTFVNRAEVAKIVNLALSNF